MSQIYTRYVLPAITDQIGSTMYNSKTSIYSIMQKKNCQKKKNPFENQVYWYAPGGSELCVLPGWKGWDAAAGLHFVLPVSDGPGPSALPAWRGGGRALTLPGVFFLLLCPSRAVLRWRTRCSSQPGGGEETH